MRVLPKPAAPGSGGSSLWLGAAAVAILLAGMSAAWWLWPRPAPPPVIQAPVQAIAPAPGVPSPPAFAIRTATERQILDDDPTALTVFRLAANPQIVVLDFPALHEQGKMLNRVAAFVEKAGAKRDQVLTDSELDQAIRSDGATIDTYYYGHDYSAASLARFFAQADSQHLELDQQEEQLRALLQQLGWFAPDVTAGLISLPAVGADKNLTLAARDTVLQHELSHGEFFSNPEYADYVHRFWLTELSEPERAGVRKFLGRDGYDTGEEVLMYNEMQAYFMFTHNPLFFSPDMAGMTAERLLELQKRFLAGMPAGWLREVLANYLNDTVRRLGKNDQGAFAP